MPATTELKLFGNCWHFLLFKYSFLYPFGLSISTEGIHSAYCGDKMLQYPVSRAFHFYLKRCKRSNWVIKKLQYPVSRAFHFYCWVKSTFSNGKIVAIPGISGFPFLHDVSRIKRAHSVVLQYPVSRAFHFYGTLWKP